MFDFDLSQDIETFILGNPICKEYDLVRYLQAKHRLPQTSLNTPLALFRTHFLVFNALYRLKSKCIIHQKYHIDISSIQIQVIEYPSNSSGQQALDGFDPLSLFYLNLNHLNQTQETDVIKLLEQFWTHYFDDGQKKKALKTLNLSEPVDSKTIKTQYRRLAMQHHPDRGGDADALIEIHQAVECLQQYYP